MSSSGIHYRHDVKDRIHTYVILYEMGKKWSYFLNGGSKDGKHYDTWKWQCCRHPVESGGINYCLYGSERNTVPLPSGTCRPAQPFETSKYPVYKVAKHPKSHPNIFQFLTIGGSLKY
jgi:hypothetical protein